MPVDKELPGPWKWKVQRQVRARASLSAPLPEASFSVSGYPPLRNGEPGGARIGGIFRCPESKAPDAGKHCDSVTGAFHSGEENLATATAKWSP